ncbi:hypothetical protein N7G274_002759 [Stereocaulon virgatum]|uniref:Uncharacterized protein n=1 Tax=Stereocaulon virgatum TaxID=373712 RepID=A0ABR4AGS6_9LECA
MATQPLDEEPQLPFNPWIERRPPVQKQTQTPSQNASSQPSGPSSIVEATPPRVPILLEETEENIPASQGIPNIERSDSDLSSLPATIPDSQPELRNQVPARSYRPPKRSRPKISAIHEETDTITEDGVEKYRCNHCKKTYCASGAAAVTSGGLEPAPSGVAAVLLRR